MKYTIELLKTKSGYRFNFRQAEVEKIITWAGTEEAMNIEEEALAVRMQKSLNDHPVWFDESGNMMIPSPLYFVYSIQHTGLPKMINQIENWGIFWSQDAFFHRSPNQRVAAAQEGLAGPVIAFLKSRGLAPVLLPEAPYEDWEELEEKHFLSEDYMEKLHAFLLGLPESKIISILYLAFNSPHLVGAMAWTEGYFSNSEAFAHYTLVYEGLLSPMNINAEDFENEVQLRVKLFSELQEFIANPD